MQSELRRYYRESRRQFIDKEGQAAAKRLSANLRRLLSEQAVGDTQVCLYRPMAEEASFDLKALNHYFYPCLKGEELEFRRPSGDEDFRANAYGVLEPILEKSSTLNASCPALVCCPAVAVDWRGQRLGMGKGYYDRYFASHPEATRVAVVYQIQVAKDPLPAESWDQPVDWIVTEEMILRTANRSQ